MKISDIKKIIREELSEGDVIDFEDWKMDNRWHGEKKQAELKQTVLDDIGTYTQMAMQNPLKDPREAMAIQRLLQGKNKQEFLNKILNHLYKKAGPRKSQIGSLRKRYYISKKNPLSKEQELDAVEEGVRAAIKELGPDRPDPSEPRSYIRSADDPRELKKRARQWLASQGLTLQQWADLRKKRQQIHTSKRNDDEEDQ
jgi:hypothetical protein